MRVRAIIVSLLGLLIAESCYAYSPKQIEFYAKQLSPRKNTCVQRARIAKEVAERDGWATRYIHEVNSRGRHRALALIDKTGKVWEILH